MFTRSMRMAEVSLREKAASRASREKDAHDGAGASDGNSYRKFVASSNSKENFVNEDDANFARQVRNSTKDRLQALTMNDPKVQASLASEVAPPVAKSKKEPAKKKPSVSANALKSAMFG